MNIKEKIKNEIDLLSDEFVEDVLEYLYSLKSIDKPKKKILGLHLKGQFDDVNIRQKAYE